MWKNIKLPPGKNWLLNRSKHFILWLFWLLFWNNQMCMLWRPLSCKNPKAPFRLTNSCFSWLWQRIYIMPSLQIKTSLSTCAYGDPAEKQKGHICWMQVTNLNRSFAFAQERFFFKSKPFLTCMFVTVPCKSFLFAHGSQNLSF